MTAKVNNKTYPRLNPNNTPEGNPYRFALKLKFNALNNIRKKYSSKIALHLFSFMSKPTILGHNQTSKNGTQKTHATRLHSFHFFCPSYRL